MRFQTRTRKRRKRPGVAKRAFMYFVPMAVVVSAVMLCLYWVGSYSLAAEVELASRRLLDKHVSALRFRLKTAAEDVRILAAEAGRLGVFDRSDEATDHMGSLAASLVAQRKVYQVIRVLDIGGREVMRLEFTPGGTRYVGGPEMIVRPPWPHIDAALTLPPRQVLLLPADQTEHVPSTVGPTNGAMCLVSPIRDDHRKCRGALVVEYRPSSLFGDITEDGPDHSIALVDSRGFMLSDSTEASFPKSCPIAWERMGGNRAGRLYTSEGLFTYVSIDPMYSLNESVDPFAGSLLSTIDTAGDWKLIGRIAPYRLPSMNRVRQSLFGSSLGVLLVLLAAGAWRLARFSRMRADAERGLREARRTAEFANASKTQFLANMSHEIRTPMTAVLGYSNLLIDPNLPADERSECLQTLQRNGEHLLTLINDILDITRIEAGKLSVRQSDCDITAIVAEVVSMMRIRASRRNVDLSVEYATEVPRTIVSDGPRIRQTLINLVGNAVKFTEEGQIRIVVRYLPKWRRGIGAMQVDVIDTGVGIEPAELERIFKPFTQATSVGSHGQGGSGLGLAISRSIVRLLGGDLTAASTPGLGSVFTMVLPTGAEAEPSLLTRPAESAVEAGPSLPAPDSLKGMRILLAEDGPDNQRLIQTLLAKAGATVDLAENGAEAFTEGRKGGYDLIFMDMQMPIMDGFEATRRLRNMGVKTPVVALTAHALAGDRDRCIEAGCTDYMSKPILRDRLIEIALRNTGRAVAQTACRHSDEPEVIASEVAASEGIDDLVDDFIDGLPHAVAAMTDALIHGNFTNLGMFAHRLRGSGGGFGYPALSDAAAAVEDAATAEDTETATLTMMILIAVCQAIGRGRNVRMQLG